MADGGPRPSRKACSSGWMPRSAATWAIGRPGSNTSPTPRSSNSSGYFLGLGIIGDLPSSRTESWRQGLRQTRPGSWIFEATFGQDVKYVWWLIESSFGFELEVIVERTDGLLQHYWRDGTGCHEGPSSTSRSIERARLAGVHREPAEQGPCSPARGRSLRALSANGCAPGRGDIPPRCNRVGGEGAPAAKRCRGPRRRATRPSTSRSTE